MADKKHRTEPKRGPLMRISYAHGLRKPMKNDSGVDKYNVTLILPKADKEGLALLQSMVAETVVGEWGEKGKERFAKGLIKNPILDGGGASGLDQNTGEPKAGLGDSVIFIRPTSNDPVKVFNAAVQPASDEEIVSGHWGYPVLNCFAWHNPKNGDGVSFGISMFQFARADEVLGGSNLDPGEFFEKVQTEAGTEGSDGSGAASMFG